MPFKSHILTNISSNYLFLICLFVFLHWCPFTCLSLLGWRNHPFQLLFPSILCFIHLVLFFWLFPYLDDKCARSLWNFWVITNFLSKYLVLPWSCTSTLYSSCNCCLHLSYFPFVLTGRFIYLGGINLHQTVILEQSRLHIEDSGILVCVNNQAQPTIDRITMFHQWTSTRHVWFNFVCNYTIPIFALLLHGGFNQQENFIGFSSKTFLLIWWNPVSVCIPVSILCFKHRPAFCCHCSSSSKQDLYSLTFYE